MNKGRGRGRGQGQQGSGNKGGRGGRKPSSRGLDLEALAPACSMWRRIHWTTSTPTILLIQTHGWDRQ
eukprot:3668461-Amphidinium_carterae.1